MPPSKVVDMSGDTPARTCCQRVDVNPSRGHGGGVLQHDNITSAAVSTDNSDHGTAGYESGDRYDGIVGLSPPAGREEVEHQQLALLSTYFSEHGVYREPHVH